VITTDDDLRAILTTASSIAVVGASQKPWRASHDIAHYLIEAGYTVFPVNPAYEEVLGRRCYPTLASIGSPVDIVDVFRNPDALVPIVGDAIAIGAKTIWMQSGVVNEEAARRAEEAGLNVVMDRCIAVDHRFLVRG
jgi:predicted CoA-binding protein